MARTLADYGINGLPRDERLELLGLIWESIVEQDPISGPLPEAHRREIERRIAEAEANPSAGIPWEQVRARLLGSP